MPRNTEIKARIPSVAELMPRTAALADTGPTELLQDDTFFACPRGRLKLRTFSPDRGELIFYRRDDQAGPKTSTYRIAPTTEPDRLRETLTLAYGQTGRVRKHRTLFLVGRARIHLDRVEGLGDFLELEVVLEEQELLETGVREAEQLMSALGVEPVQLVKGAYLDLLAAQEASNEKPTAG